MALTFDGSTSHLSRVASGMLSSYPFTIFLWTRALNYQTGFAAHIAVDPSPTSGLSEGHGVIQSSATMQAWSTSSGTGGATAAYSARSVTTGDWIPSMVVFTSAGLRKVYYGSGGVRTSTVSVQQSPNVLNVLSIGKQAVRSAYYWAGDLACVGLWRAELTQADFDNLASGVVPKTVQPGALVDYWPLLNQAASQSGVNGGVLTANNTAQASSHPIKETVGPPDTTSPTLVGTITVSGITSSGYTLAWPAGSDNVSVTGYERSLDGGGSWQNLGTILTLAVSSRTPGSSDQVRIRALDGAGNSSAALAVTVTLLAQQDTLAPTLSGAITVSALTTTGYALSWPAANDNVGVIAYDLSLSGGLSWTNAGNTTGASVSQRTPGSTDSVLVRARDAAGNVSASLSVSVTLPLPLDATPPTLTGTLSVSGLTSTSYNLAWPSASDNLAVTAYERSLDGGQTWANIGNVLSAGVTGRTPGSSDQVRVRARDAAGNVSSPALATSVSLPGVTGAAGFATPSLKNNTGTVLANLSGLTINVYNRTTGALVVQLTGMSSSAAGVVSINDAALVGGTSYAYEVVTPSSGRRLPLATAS